MTTATKRRQEIGAAVVIVVCAAIGIALATQGWRSRITTFDLIPAVERAQEFIASGRVPDRGILTSFASYSPPGTVWLMLPGVLTAKDPRLFEFVGSSLLYLGTIAGVFFLARTYFGLRCAVPAAGLYALSKLGLFYSTTLWPRGHPFFYVWMAYCAAQWVAQRNAKYLAAAIVTWAAGMYVFMEIAPAVFILPIIWFLYRPPLKLQPLFLAGLAILVLWFPYLRFEYGRGFVDIRSQVSRQDALPSNYQNSWCDPRLELKSTEVLVDEASVEGGAGSTAKESLRTKLMASLGSLWGRWNWLSANFDHTTKIPGNSIVLTLMALMSLFLISVSPAPANPATASDRQRLWRTGLALLAAGMMFFALVCNEWVIARFASQDGTMEASTVTSIRWLQTTLLAVGLILIALGAKIAASIDRFKSAFTDAPHEFHKDAPNGKVFAICLIVPWVVLLVLVEGVDHLGRFWWLWPLQLIALVALVSYLPARLRLPRIFAVAGFACLSIMLLLHPLLLERVQSWKSSGWSGSDAVEIRLVNSMAQRLAGKNRTAIGYQTYIWRFMAMFNAVDPRYKVGADIDLLYRALHGISNTDQCAEGISPEDEFRIVQVRPNWSDPKGKGYFELQPDKNFQFLEQFGPYQVYQRF